MSKYNVGDILWTTNLTLEGETGEDGTSVDIYKVKILELAWRNVVSRYYEDQDTEEELREFWRIDEVHDNFLFGTKAEAINYAKFQLDKCIYGS